jgi:GNAT superfamily N-acetyltransferase
LDQKSQNWAVQLLSRGDLQEAGAILRLAFATQLGVAPDTFWTDRDFVTGRWLTDRSLGFGAWLDGHLVGSGLAANWGSVGVLGPISTHPTTWNRGTASYLLSALLERLDEMGVRHTGLFTPAESTKHVALYQKFGFWPRFLTAIMTRSVASNASIPRSTRYSAIREPVQAQYLDACRALTGELRDGLDLTAEVRGARRHGHGDTVFLVEGSRIEAVAHCEYGPKSPAGAGSCLIRFAAVRPASDADKRFDLLLAACETLARDEGLARVVVCVNASRPNVYRHLLLAGFRTERLGVTMHRPNEDAYKQEATHILEDWR